jgi:hypothetical protein
MKAAVPLLAMVPMFSWTSSKVMPMPLSWIFDGLPDAVGNDFYA